MKRFALVLSLVMVFTIFGAAAAFAAPGDYYYGTGYYTGTSYPSYYYTSTIDSTSGKADTNAWGIDNDTNPNANSTGMDAFGSVDGTGVDLDAAVKNVAAQRVHGEYMNDTNSCASCHQTHTAAGKALLMKNGVYNTCTACHDGTLGFYNVFSNGGADNDPNAGTFGGDPTMGASVHLATGDLKVSAAPGGNRTDTDPQDWGKDFTCSSCHSAHGSYSDRLLHYNANMVSVRTPADGGLAIIGANDFTTATVGSDTVFYSAAYSKFNNADPDAVSPWVYGYYMTSSPKLYYTQIKVNSSASYNGVSWNDLLRIDYRNGAFTDPSGLIQTGDVVTADIAPSIVVKVAKGPATNYWGGTTGDPDVYFNVTGYEKGVNEYCSACHWDYATGSVAAGNPTGKWSSAFRHSMKGIGVVDGMPGQTDSGALLGNQGGQAMVCLSCHFAHGTSKEMMKTADDTVGTNADENPSSALKRYVNMAVCWKCHTAMKNEQLINNDSYWDKVTDGAGEPHNGFSELVYP